MTEIIPISQFRPVRIDQQNLKGKKRGSYAECRFLAKNAIPVVAKIINFPRSPFWIKKCPGQMATIVAKIMYFFSSEYWRVPPFFFDSKGGAGEAKNVNNYGHHR